MLILHGSENLPENFYFYGEEMWGHLKGHPFKPSDFFILGHF